jgi:hypothetical protein
MGEHGIDACPIPSARILDEASCARAAEVASRTRSYMTYAGSEACDNCPGGCYWFPGSDLTEAGVYFNTVNTDLGTDHFERLELNIQLLCVMRPGFTFSPTPGPTVTPTPAPTVTTPAPSFRDRASDPTPAPTYTNKPTVFPSQPRQPAPVFKKNTLPPARRPSTGR